MWQPRWGVMEAAVVIRRPKAGRPGRRAFVSGKKKQNTLKFTKVTDGAAAPWPT
ncbi:MAG TPA: hypothetical protein VF933_09435 [Streptosporangiaceae bacterium]